MWSKKQTIYSWNKNGSSSLEKHPGYIYVLSTDLPNLWFHALSYRESSIFLTEPQYCNWSAGVPIVSYLFGDILSLDDQKRYSLWFFQEKFWKMEYQLVLLYLQMLWEIIHRFYDSCYWTGYNWCCLSLCYATRFRFVYSHQEAICHWFMEASSFHQNYGYSSLSHLYCSQLYIVRWDGCSICSFRNIGHSSSCPHHINCFISQRYQIILLGN